MLTDSQQKDLEKAILEYMTDHNYSQACENLKKESKFPDELE